MAAGAKIGMKVITLVIGIPVGIATRKIVERAWAGRRARTTRPRKPTEDGVQLGRRDRLGRAVGRRHRRRRPGHPPQRRGRLPGDHRQPAAAGQADQGREEAGEGLGEVEGHDD